MTNRWLRGGAVAAALAVAVIAGLALDRRSSSQEPAIDPGDGGEYAPKIEAADFVDSIDNPYFPLTLGSRWVYEGTVDGETERVEVVVTQERKVILGISAVVVRDTVTVAGTVVEDTFDWFAQDRAGNVWYLGEDSKEFEDGEVSTAGSWEAGVNGALPGIVMPAQPAVEVAYRQEFYPGEAEDLAEVVRLQDAVTVRIGAFDDVVVTKEWTPLEPDSIEAKFYAPGVGLVLQEQTAGGSARVELIEYTPG